MKHNGYYERSPTYAKIIDKRLVGVFNVPYVYGAVLMKASKLPDILKAVKTYGSKAPWITDDDVLFAYALRKMVFLNLKSLDITRNEWSNLFPGYFHVGRQSGKLWIFDPD